MSQLKPDLRIQVFPDKRRKWRVRLRAKNSRILMSSEAYSSKRKAMHAAGVICAGTCGLTIIQEVSK